MKYCIELLQFEFLMKHDLKDELVAGITRFWRARYHDEVHDIHQSLAEGDTACDPAQKAKRIEGK